MVSFTCVYLGRWSVVSVVLPVGVTNLTPGLSDCFMRV